MLESRSEWRLRSAILVANLNVAWLVAISNPCVACALQVSGNHLCQVANDLSQIGTILNFVLDVRE